MIGKNIVDRKEITLSHVRKYLEERREDSEIGYEQEITLELAQKFGKKDPEDAEELVEEIADIGRIKRSMAVMIVQNSPKDKEDLNVLLEKKRYTLDDSQKEKILDLVAEYE